MMLQVVFGALTSLFARLAIGDLMGIDSITERAGNELGESPGLMASHPGLQFRHFECYDAT
ncbi:MAG: hypothetical protein ACLPSO_01480, partial [Terracidiphilus sp.]